MRTTINLPEDLIKEALRVSQCRTKTMLFKLALNNIIQQNKIVRLKDFKGKVDLSNIDLNTLRKRG